ncbi:anthrone oxygenase family protein [Actinomycetospora sp. NBRC 106378]|uniref:anthrone oxygenase family protein n=1 Tax=Actinomycetospora sp. NBRC 106378 TaxID=3032208 RepID=UPI0024A182D5|nr:anthrone oxygenase family protein [Actinomycetospora sp. NBRC 106378]GLZ55497.1 hypothetical protein Acsp07_51140 [Actinomycetospora sp. NBRC 106378]
MSVLCLVLSGVLAGGELLVRWGLAPALRALPDDAHVRARIAVVHRLRLVVPAVIVPTVVVTVVVVARGGDAAAWAAVGALAVFVVVTGFGTVPINMRIARWDPTDPPADWQGLVRRWERVDVLRSSAALLTFVLLAVARLP